MERDFHSMSAGIFSLHLFKITRNYYFYLKKKCWASSLKKAADNYQETDGGWLYNS
jgi:hypothetical protein